VFNGIIDFVYSFVFGFNPSQSILRRLSSCTENAELQVGPKIFTMPRETLWKSRACRDENDRLVGRGGGRAAGRRVSGQDHRRVCAGIIFAGVLVVLWVLFAVFTFYFFRDPDPMTPTGPNLVIAPGHGKVDAIDTTTEPDFMGGECQRVSIFLSVFDVHVQNAPVTGRVAFSSTRPAFISTR
jgi:hypothetical protein